MLGRFIKLHNLLILKGGRFLPGLPMPPTVKSKQNPASLIVWLIHLCPNALIRKCLLPSLFLLKD
jgi:hypothetical protein